MSARCRFEQRDVRTESFASTACLHEIHRSERQLIKLLSQETVSDMRSTDKQRSRAPTVLKVNTFSNSTPGTPQKSPATKAERDWLARLAASQLRSTVLRCWLNRAVRGNKCEVFESVRDVQIFLTSPFLRDISREGRKEVA